MANCNKHFDEFNSEIRLTESRRKKLKVSRKELRNKIRNWFKEYKPGSKGSQGCRILWSW